MLQRVRSISYCPDLKIKRSGGLQESVVFEMTDISLHVKLVIMNLLEYSFSTNLTFSFV